MSAGQNNKTIVRRIYEEYLDELDPAAADELLADDVVLHAVRAFGEGAGRETVKEGFSAFLSSFAERHTDVEDLIAEGDRIVARHTHHLTRSSYAASRPTSCPPARGTAWPSCPTARWPAAGCRAAGVRTPVS